MGTCGYIYPTVIALQYRPERNVAKVFWKDTCNTGVEFVPLPGTIISLTGIILKEGGVCVTFFKVLCKDRRSQSIA